MNCPDENAFRGKMTKIRQDTEDIHLDHGAEKRFEGFVDLSR